MTASSIIATISCCAPSSRSHAAILRPCIACSRRISRGAAHAIPWLDWHPSAGSIFKKIDGAGAGRLVDQCGLKGRRVGDAQISHLHANIIVNLGHATARDVRELIGIAQEAVRARFALELTPEIKFVGEF